MADQGADIQDEELVSCILADHERLKRKREPYESTFRDIDRFIDPFGGGFSASPAGNRDIEDLYDITAIEHLGRGTAVIAGVTIPRNQRWHGLAFGDKDLDKLPEVRRWCEHATDRLFACRYASHAGFEVQAHEDIRQELKYGTAPFWIGEVPGRSLFYKSLHLSEIWIDENYFGRIDTVHRGFELTLREARKQYGIDALPERWRSELEDPRKLNDKRPFLQVIRPADSYEKDALGAKGKPIESIVIVEGEKHVVSRSGFYTMPIVVSRHITGPKDVYGRSPAMTVLPTVRGLNAMVRTLLDAGNRAVNPPLLFYDDADITSLITKPGGLTPGGLDEYGREMVKPLLTGENIPLGREMTEDERQVVRRPFLEEFFRLLSDPSDRMTATQVLETLQKEGVLIAPFAGRRETEKLGPVVERELDLLLRANQIAPMPDVAKEARAWPRAHMTNPLARMARAEEVAGFSRWAEIGVQAASAGAPEALDRINWDAGMRDVGEVLGVRPTHIHTDDEVAAKRAAREEEKAAAMAAQVVPQAAGAALDLAKANELAAGGGLG